MASDKSSCMVSKAVPGNDSFPESILIWKPGTHAATAMQFVNKAQARMTDGSVGVHGLFSECNKKDPSHSEPRTRFADNDSMCHLNFGSAYQVNRIIKVYSICWKQERVPKPNHSSNGSGTAQAVRWIWRHFLKPGGLRRSASATNYREPDASAFRLIRDAFPDLKKRHQVPDRLTSQFAFVRL
jgi:hypothetical protein